MGKAVESAALMRGWSISQRIARGDALLHDADVAIEFTHPDSVIANIESLAPLGKPIVVGTTGWEKHRDRVRILCEEHNIGILYADNFSLGMQLFLRTVAEAARHADEVGGYDVGGWEAHHNQKADSPSGTARSIAQVLLDNMKSKQRVLFEPTQRPMESDEIHFASLRCGAIPGTHAVTFSSPGDSITLTHQAHNRAAWANGALDAAKWLQGKTGLFSIEDLLGAKLCKV